MDIGQMFKEIDAFQTEMEKDFDSCRDEHFSNEQIDESHDQYCFALKEMIAHIKQHYGMNKDFRDIIRKLIKFHLLTWWKAQRHENIEHMEKMISNFERIVEIQKEQIAMREEQVDIHCDYTTHQEKVIDELVEELEKERQKNGNVSTT